MLQTKSLFSPGSQLISPEEETGVLHRFAGTIRFPTISVSEGLALDSFHNMRTYSMGVWNSVFNTLEMELHGGASILLKWVGADPSLEPVMLAAHQDVVPVGDGNDWSRDPFGGDISNGRIWGRGTIDYKCGYSGMLEAVSLLISRGFTPGRTVFLAFGHDEEIGGLHGAKAIVDSLLSRNIACSSVLDEGGYIYSEANGDVVAEVAIAEKGYASFRLSSEAVQGHSSVPPDKTAIGLLARGIVALEDSSMPPAEVPSEISSSKWLLSTIAPTVFFSGCKENVLPAKAEAVINTRPAPGSSVDMVHNYIQNVVEPFGISVELIDNPSVSEPSSISSTRTMDFKALKTSVLNNIVPGTGFRCGVFPAATDSRRYSLVAKNTYRFLPVHMDHRGIGALHSVDESISIPDYLRCVRFYAEYITRVGSKG